MAAHWDTLLVVMFVLLFFVNPSLQQLQSSQTQVLLQLRRQLEYPKQMDAWNYTKDLCSVPTSPSLSITCEESSVTELKIVGDRLVKMTEFEGHSIPDQTLSQAFSVDSFVTTLTRLTSLRVVILVSLGIWGPLPGKLHRLYSLEVLDLSSNFLYGLIPPKISAMGMVQTLTLDGNFFNGTVPDWLDSLSNLTVLSLKSNRLKGPLPRSLGGIRTLTSLTLSSNSISGTLPDLSGLTNLEVLDLRENELDSELPVLPIGVVTVLLSRNSLSGEIPQQLGELTRLQHLDMSFNLLHGTPPASLFSLPNITYLNLESNMLGGSLPSGLACTSQLGFVDISTNKLTGDLPSCLSANSNKRIVKFSGNCLVIDPKHQHEASYCKETDMNLKRSDGRGIGALIGVIGGAAILLILSLLVFLVFCRRKCQRAVSEQRLLQKPAKKNSSTCLSTELLQNASLFSQTTKVGTQVPPMYRVFSLEELQEATNGFNPSTYIGEGSIGKVYKGRLQNGTYVAIKCLAFFKKYPIRNLKLRLDLLSKFRHPHLVCLLGHCTDGASDNSSVSRVFLVYEYIPTGNLRTLLSESRPERALKWPDRLMVLIGVAKAVHFLHTGIIPGFFNNRLKTSNILLDEHHMAKVSDYGLSIITEEIDKHESRADKAKSSYAIQSKFPAWEGTNLDDDVYMFGFILLEALAGPSIIKRGEAFFLNELVCLRFHLVPNCLKSSSKIPKLQRSRHQTQKFTGSSSLSPTHFIGQLMATISSNQEQLRSILDPAVMNTSAQGSLSIVASIMNKCLSPDPSFRPSIEDLVWNLQYAEQVQATIDSDQKSDVNSQT